MTGLIWFTKILTAGLDGHPLPNFMAQAVLVSAVVIVLIALLPAIAGSTWAFRASDASDNVSRSLRREHRCSLEAADLTAPMNPANGAEFTAAETAAGRTVLQLPPAAQVGPMPCVGHDPARHSRTSPNAA